MNHSDMIRLTKSTDEISLNSISIRSAYEAFTKLFRRSESLIILTLYHNANESRDEGNWISPSIISKLSKRLPFDTNAYNTDRISRTSVYKSLPNLYKYGVIQVESTSNSEWSPRKLVRLDPSFIKLVLEPLLIFLTSHLHRNLDYYLK